MTAPWNQVNGGPPKADTVNWNDITSGVSPGPPDYSQGPPGPPGPVGPPGAASTIPGPPGPPGTGTRGSLWYQGNGVPSVIGGSLNQDQYLDNLSANVYTFGTGAWTQTGNIRGATGATGATGLTGSVGPAGVQGAQGNVGAKGDPGVGLPAGGNTGQVLAKQSNADYDFLWAASGGGGGGGLGLPLTQNLTFSPDNTLDIGGSSSTLRPRNVYAGSQFVVGTNDMYLSSDTLSGGTSGIRLNASNGFLRFQINNTTCWYLDSPSGRLLANTDNAVDIGQSGSNRPRNVYVATGSYVGPFGGALGAGDLGVSRADANSGAIFFGNLNNYMFFDSGVPNGQVTFRYGATNAQMNITLLVPQNNTLEQRNGTNAQTFRIYNTYTDASNYERGFLRWASNQCQVGTEAAGTGVGRDLNIGSWGAGSALIFTSSGVSNWFIAAAGQFAPLIDNASDIGVSGSVRRVRNVFVAGAVATGVKAGAAVDGDVSSPTDGMIRIDSTNNRIYARVGGTWRYAALT